MSAFFTQSCPICGRRVHISDDHAELSVACQHCQANFIACDPTDPACLHNSWGDALLQRADELLALAELRLVRQPGETTSLTVVT